VTSHRPPDFDELIGTEVSPGDRDRLRRVHELLVAAGPPAELPPSLADPGGDAAVVPFRRPSRRRLAVAAILAAAVAAAAFGAGFFLGESDGEGDAAAVPDYVVEMTGADEARASLAVFAEDDAGNWPMRMTVQGLDGGETYQLWLTRDGKLERLCGAFSAGDERTVVEMNAPYPLKRYDGWVVTREGGERPVLTEAAS
jgi:Anti-sigma-K factor rskA